jgi:hypothetical protein
MVKEFNAGFSMFGVYAGISRTFRAGLKKIIVLAQNALFSPEYHLFRYNQQLVIITIEDYKRIPKCSTRAFQILPESFHQYSS